MKIILKHILRNIKEKKIRSILIILSLVVATMVFVLNLTLPDEIIVKIQETLRSVHGKTEVAIYSTGEFNIKDVKLGNEKITYTGSKSIIGIIENKQILIYGFDIDNAKKFNLLGEDVCNLSDNEVVVGKKIAEKYEITVEKKGFKSLYGIGTIENKKVILCKPQTFMNLSGEAIFEISNFYKIKPENIIVIYDDIDLPEAQVKIRKKGRSRNA